jgi:hypothetical protein
VNTPLFHAQCHRAWRLEKYWRYILRSIHLNIAPLGKINEEDIIKARLPRQCCGRHHERSESHALDDISVSHTLDNDTRLTVDHAVPNLVGLVARPNLLQCVFETWLDSEFRKQKRLQLPVDPTEREALSK